MKNNTIQSLAKQAKLRIQRGYNPDKAPTDIVESQLKTDEQSMYLKVVEMMKSEEIIVNPISRLMDDEYFATLSEEGKGRYVLELAKLYVELKNRYKATLAM